MCERAKNVPRIKIERNPSKERLKELGVEKWSEWTSPVTKFDWEYSGTEMAYVYEGRVKVKTDIEEVEIKAGDLVTFPDGLKCTWTVLEPIRKVYHFP